MTTFKLFAAFVVCSFSFLFSNVAVAQIVYDNGVGGPAGIDDAFSSDLDVTIIGADDFSLASTQTISVVEWSGVYAFFDTPPATDDFTVEIYADSSGVPGTLLSSTNVGNSVNRTDSGFDDPVLGFDVYEYSANVTPFAATAGTTYWLSIYGNTVGEDDDWLWGIVNGTGNSAQSNDLGSNWFVAGHQMDFRLIGPAVPEPSSVSLLGLLFLFVATQRRMRRFKLI